MKLSHTGILAGLALIGMTAALPGLAQVQFVSPIGGTPYQSWTIVNYVDDDPTSPGIRDFRGGSYTYDGHRGIDLTLPNFAAMDAGLPVFAAASGIVVAAHDGEFDRCSRIVMCGDNPNFVIIDHGFGIQSIYVHLRSGSVQAPVGTPVLAGQQIGLVGSSGLSSDAHLHFEVHQFGNAVDTEFIQPQWWVTPFAYAGDRRGVLDGGITDHGPSLAELQDRPHDKLTFSQAAGQQADMWINLFGTDDGDLLAFDWFRPNGSLYAHQTWIVGEIHFGWWIAAIGLPTVPDAGTWHVQVSDNGAALTAGLFQVIAVPEPPPAALLPLGLAGLALRRGWLARQP